DETANGTVVRLHPRLEAAKDKPIACDGHRLARLQARLADRLVGARPGDADCQEHDRGMHHVAAVPPAVTCDERRERGWHAGSSYGVAAAARTRAPVSPRRSDR